MATAISTDRFTKHGPGKYSAEISELSHGNAGIFTKLYVDALDEGFILQCAVSNRQVRMRLTRAHRDDVEGETTHWTFEADPADIRRLKIKPIVVNVWND